jgi:hypothetical protein
MTGCDEIREALFLGGQLNADGTAHLRDCERCRQDAVALRVVAEALARDTSPESLPTLTPRVLAAAKPLLAEHARAARRLTSPQLLRAVTMALVLLPIVLLFDAYVLSGVYRVLSALVPAPVRTYLVFNLGAVVLLLITLTYAAVPLLAERQARWTQRGN